MEPDIPSGVSGFFMSWIMSLDVCVGNGIASYLCMR